MSLIGRIVRTRDAALPLLGISLPQPNKLGMQSRLSTGQDDHRGCWLPIAREDMLSKGGEGCGKI